MAYKNDKTKNRKRYKSRYRSAHNYKHKRSTSQTKVAVLVSVLTFVIIASVVIIFTFGDSIYDSLNQTLENITATDAPTIAPTNTPTKAPTKAPTKPPTEPPTEPLVEQDEEFNNLLALNNLKLENILGDQLIFVDSNEADLTCKLYCYEKDANGKWNQALSVFDGFVGSQGVSETMTPYEAKTPQGLFRIEYAAGTNPDPGAKIEYDQFLYDDYWVTDPNSAYYNRWMHTLNNCDWASSQELWVYTVSYPYCVVFDYNRSNVDHSQGCAKFLHVKYAPTDGGVGISENDLYTIIMWLDSTKNPYISISK